MYIKRVYKRMMNMHKNTWRFMTMCFILACFYLFAAIIMMITNDESANIVLIRNALEIASMSQAVLIICAVGSVIIEEAALNREK